ncbi:uncharacterized protein ACNLHF_002581 [Anomaloglossus baeobatrachus]
MISSEGTQPSEFDKMSQAEDNDDFQQETPVRVWEDTVDQKAIDCPREDRELLRRLFHDLHLVNTIGIVSAAPSAMELDTPPSWSPTARTTQPWEFDKMLQAEDNNNYRQETPVRVWEDTVDPKAMDCPRDDQEVLRRLFHALHLVNTIGISSAAPSAMELDTPPSWSPTARTTYQDLQAQAAFSNPVATSRVREPEVLPKKEEDYHFYRYIEEKMEQLPPDMKLLCMQKVMEVVHKYAVAQAVSSKKPKPP